MVNVHRHSLIFSAQILVLELGRSGFLESRGCSAALLQEQRAPRSQRGSRRALWPRGPGGTLWPNTAAGRALKGDVLGAAISPGTDSRRKGCPDATRGELENIAGSGGRYFRDEKISIAVIGHPARAIQASGENCFRAVRCKFQNFAVRTAGFDRGRNQIASVIEGQSNWPLRSGESRGSDEDTARAGRRKFVNRPIGPGARRKNIIGTVEGDTEGLGGNRPESADTAGGCDFENNAGDIVDIG